MPTGVPAVPEARVVNALQRAGFTVVRINGSHHVIQHPDGRTVSVPVHTYDMPKGTLRKVLAIIGMTADELRDLL